MWEALRKAFSNEKSLEVLGSETKEEIRITRGQHFWKIYLYQHVLLKDVHYCLSFMQKEQPGNSTLMALGLYHPLNEQHSLMTREQSLENEGCDFSCYRPHLITHLFLRVQGIVIPNRCISWLPPLSSCFPQVQIYYLSSFLRGGGTFMTITAQDMNRQ